MLTHLALDIELRDVVGQSYRGIDSRLTIVTAAVGAVTLLNPLKEYCSKSLLLPVTVFESGVADTPSIWKFFIENLYGVESLPDTGLYSLYLLYIEYYRLFVN